ncbi:MAG: AAA family ATPase [Nitrospinales bacterium]
MVNIIPDTLADKIIEGKIKEWEEKRRMGKEAQKQTPHPFLTVSRDFGCGEETIIPALEKEFGWHVYGKDLLNFVVEREGVSRAVLETLDEKRKGEVYDWVNNVLGAGVIYQKEYALKVSHLIKTIVMQESAIILGRGGNHILNGKPEGLRIKITAPFDERVSHISQIREMGLEAAKDLVLEKDKDRQEFIDNYFHGNDKDLEGFDLAFNTSAFNEKSICKMTHLAMKEKDNI